MDPVVLVLNGITSGGRPTSFCFFLCAKMDGVPDSPVPSSRPQSFPSPLPALSQDEALSLSALVQQLADRDTACEAAVPSFRS